MYSAEVALSRCNVKRVLYLAKKYFVLKIAWLEYLQDYLDPSNGK